MGYALLIWTFSFFSCNGPHHTKSSLGETNIAAEQVEVEGKSEVDFGLGFSCGFRDHEGVLWFGSYKGGVYRYNGTSFTQYTERNGLCNNNVSCIMEDREGILWFGTAKGLCRFDRRNFTTVAIPQSDTSSVWLDKVYPIINPNQVVSIFQDRQGIFWIGTNGAGVYRYDGETFTQYLSKVGKVYEDGLQHNIVLEITEDLSGNVWFTSLSHAGISRFDGEKFTHFTTQDGLSDNFVRTSFCDRAGNMWIGTHGNRRGGLDRFDGTTFTNYHKTNDGLSTNNVRSIFEDQSGNLWLGSGNSKLSIFDGAHFREFRSPKGETFQKVLFVLEDEKGNTWFGGKNGLWKYDGETVTAMPETKDRKVVNYGAGDVVTKGFLDSKGNMWFTTTKEGVFKYDGKSFPNLTEKEGLCSNEVNAILEDENGILWFGTGKGLCSFNGKTFHHIPIPENDTTSDWLESGYPIINPEGIMSMVQDEEDALWIGSNGGGAYHFDGHTFTSFLKQKGSLMPDGLHHNVITSIIEDHKGNVWFSSFSHGGVSKYDGTKLTHYGTKDGLGDDMIASSYIDRLGTLWFGTRSGGMSRFNGKTFTTITESEGPCQNNMATLYEDKAGRFWVASYARGGVCLFDGEAFVPFEVAGSQNLVDVKCISEDAAGNIWFGGRYGILWRFDGDVLTDFTQKGNTQIH